MRISRPSREAAANLPGAYHRVHLTEDHARAVFWQVLIAHLARYVPPNAHVLELGAGYCYWINGVHATHKVALDIWAELPQHAAADVSAIVHDLSLGLPHLEGGPFDVVMASNVLEHFEPDVASHLCADVFACLRPGGRFILIQPNFHYAYRRYFDDYTHRAIFTDVSLSNLLRSHGFGIETLEARFLPYSLKGRQFAVRPWLINAYLRSPIKPFAGQMLVVARKPQAR
jgi:SAM-dependent methyltransferase